MMGLAPYGTPKYIDQLRNSLFLNTSDPFSLNLDKSIFELSSSANDFSFLQKILDSENLSFPLDCNNNLTEAADLAASIQKLLEETIFEIISSYNSLISNFSNNVVLGGGVALNCKMIRSIYDKTQYSIHAPNSPGDAGMVSAHVQHILLHKKSSFKYFQQSLLSISNFMVQIFQKSRLQK